MRAGGNKAAPLVAADVAHYTLRDLHLLRRVVAGGVGGGDQDRMHSRRRSSSAPAVFNDAPTALALATPSM